jgi:c-di-GMP-binding flagellar brake protein YcgR
MNISPLDTRKHLRFRLPLRMRFALISGEDRRKVSKFYRTTLWDISLGGVSIISPVLRLDGIHFFYNAIPTVRNQIMMQIYLPRQNDPLVALGYAVQGRRVRVKGKKAYLIGIHFLQINEQQGQRLRSFIESLSRTRGS